MQGLLGPTAGSWENSISNQFLRLRLEQAPHWEEACCWKPLQIPEGHAGSGFDPFAQAASFAGVIFLPPSL